MLQLCHGCVILNGMSTLRLNICLKKEVVKFADELEAKRAKRNYVKPNRSRLISDLIVEAKREEDEKRAA